MGGGELRAIRFQPLDRGFPLANLPQNTGRGLAARRQRQQVLQLPAQLAQLPLNRGRRLGAVRLRSATRAAVRSTAASRSGIRAFNSIGDFRPPTPRPVVPPADTLTGDQPLAVAVTFASDLEQRRDIAGIVLTVSIYGNDPVP